MTTTQTRGFAGGYRPARAHLLVGFAEALAAPESIWSLFDAGFRVTAFTRRGARPPIRRFSPVDLVEVASPATDWHASLDDIVRAASRLGVDALMPLDDEAVWLCARYAESADRPVVGPVGDRAAFALDKRLQVTRARAAGFAVPETMQFDSADALGSSPAHLPFPTVVKRALAVDARTAAVIRAPTVICGDRKELPRTAAAYPRGTPLVLQRWIKGTGLGIFGLMSNAGLLAVSASRKLRMVDPHGSAASAVTPVAPDSEVVAASERLLRDVGWRGLFMVELLDDGSTTWFVELNGRTWGQMALQRRLGLEYPAWAAALQLFNEEPVVGPAAFPTFLCRHLGYEIGHVLAVLKGPRTRAIAFPSRLDTLCDVAHVRRSDRWYNVRRDALGVFVQDTLQSAFEPVRRSVAHFLRRSQQ